MSAISVEVTVLIDSASRVIKGLVRIVCCGNTYTMNGAVGEMMK